MPRSRMIFSLLSTDKHYLTFSMEPPALSRSLIGLTRITTLTLSFWAVVLSAAIDCRVTLRLRPD